MCILILSGFKEVSMPARQHYQLNYKIQMLQKVFIVLSTLSSVVWASPRISERDRQAFLAYSAKYGKNYDTTEEFLMRFENWKLIDIAISENKFGFQIGHNKFSDWTPEEKDLVLNKKLGVKLPLDFETLDAQEEFDMSFWDLPDYGGGNFTHPSDYDLEDEYYDEERYLMEEDEDEEYAFKGRAPMECPKSYRWVGDKCKACQGGCAKCTSDTSCRACNSRNFVFDRRRRECNCYTGPYNPETKDCDECGEGKFWNGNSCESCGVENCDKCKKKGFCTQCNSNFTRRQGKCTCKGFFYTQASSCVICETDQFISAGQCKDCPANCSTCSSPTGLCLTCINPSFQIQNGRCSCEGSDYFVHEQTKLCTKYTYCGKGFYNDGQNNCLPCKEHCKSCNAVTGFCNICDDPSMELKNDTSLSADWHVSWEFQGQEIGQCRCAPKQAFTGGACIPLAVQCPDGAYNDGNNNCVPCPDNCTTCTDFIGFCTSCPDDTFIEQKLIDEGVCVCPPNQVVGLSGSCEPEVFCVPGQYNDGHNQCLHCLANCDECEFVTGDCLVCSPSYTLIQPQKQCSCVDGQFLDVNTNMCVDIITCPDNSYNDGINNCIQCNSDHCKECEVGTGICTTCMDTYRYNRDNDTCYCPYPETYWLQADNLCHDITYPPSGKYNKGANVFVSCPTNCTACHTDLYDFSGECTACASTFTMNDQVNPNKCTCVDKQYKINNACTACADECLLCTDGTGSCFKCDYSGYTLSNGICQCLNGKVVQDDKHCATKITCSDGQYNDGHNNCYTCQSSANCLKCSAATTCTSCKSTYTLNAKRTNQCDCRTGSQFESGGRCYDLVNCGAWYYNNGYNSCQRCRQNCTWCTGYNACTSCTSPYTLNYPSAGLCACDWYQYKYYSYDRCYTCGGGSGCGQCRDGDGRCTVCKAYWTLYYYNYNCYCWAPSYSSGGNCYPCNENCWDCSGSTCYSCRSSFTLHYPSSYRCNCQNHQYKASNVYCYSCPSYTYTCHDYTANAKTCYDTFQIINNKCACASNQFIGTSVVTGMPACISLTDCPYNKYNRGDNVCNNCPSNSNCLDCELQSGVPKCVQCRATFTYYPNEGTYGTCRCNADEYKTSGNACEKCGTNMITCYDTTGNAKTCDPTFSIINGKCQCKSTQYLSQGQCHDCPSHCTTCSSATKCLTCSSTYSVIQGLCECNPSTQFHRSSDDLCVTIADPPIGFYNDGYNNMLACGPDCAKCTSGAAGACTECMPTYTMTSGNCACRPHIQFENGNVCENIIWCGNGKYNDGRNNCGDCTTNCSTCLNSATNCTSCQSTFTLHYPSFGKCACGDGWYANQYGQCQEAKQNCSRAADLTGICTNCKPTFEYDAQNDQCRCPAQTAWNPDEDRCDDCSSGCDTCSEADFCTLCKPTYIFNQPEGTCECNSTALDNNGNGCQALSPCPDGQFNPGDQTCEDCDPGCAKCEILTGRCLQCQAGYNLLAGYCNKWRRLDELVFEGSCHSGCRKCNSFECLECEKGMIQSISDKQACVFPRKCNWPVGPVEQNENLCLDEPYSEERVVPVFEEDDITVDWRRWNVVRPAKDQGKCGGDFAFTSASIAESRFAIKTGKLYDLSEQYLLDCDTLSKGCQGGWHESAGYLLSTQGAVLERDYPFVGKKQECQHEVTENSVFKLAYPGIKQVDSNKNAFKAALRESPLQVSFKVSNELFYQYVNGVLPSDYCESDKYEGLNHSMLAIGYGADSEGEYAIVQNEWGSDWGETGIFRIRLTDDESGPCGLYLNSAYALL